MLDLYGAKGCARCDQVKSLLDKREIKYNYHNIEDEDTNYYLDIIEQENNSMFPLIIKDKKVLSLSEALNE